MPLASDRAIRALSFPLMRALSVERVGPKEALVLCEPDARAVNWGAGMGSGLGERWGITRIQIALRLWANLEACRVKELVSAAHHLMRSLCALL